MNDGIVHVSPFSPALACSLLTVHDFLAGIKHATLKAACSSLVPSRSRPSPVLLGYV
jgi:hypothetical protein